MNRYHAMYKALVVDGADPKKLGRVKVRVKGIHDGLPDNALPWAACQSQSPATKGGSSAGEPKKGAKVTVRFLEGDLNFPVWLGGVFETAADLPKNHKAGRFVLYESPDQSVTIAVNENLGDIEIKTTNFNTTLGAIVDGLLQHTHMTPAGVSGMASTGVPPLATTNFTTGALK